MFARFIPICLSACIVMSIASVSIAVADDEATEAQICHNLAAFYIACQGQNSRSAADIYERCVAYLVDASPKCVAAEKELFACMQKENTCSSIERYCAMENGRASLSCPDFLDSVLKR